MINHVCLFGGRQEESMPFRLTIESRWPVVVGSRGACQQMAENTAVMFSMTTIGPNKIYVTWCVPTIEIAFFS